MNVFVIEQNRLEGRVSDVLGQDPQKSILRQGVLCKWIIGEVFLRETNKEEGQAENGGGKKSSKSSGKVPQKGLQPAYQGGECSCPFHLWLKAAVEECHSHVPPDLWASGRSSHRVRRQSSGEELQMQAEGSEDTLTSREEYTKDIKWHEGLWEQQGQCLTEGPMEGE